MPREALPDSTVKPANKEASLTEILIDAVTAEIKNDKDMVLPDAVKSLAKNINSKRL